MNIIPVLDLMNGQVVHAKRGERAHYLPIQSVLTHSSEPLAVVKALWALYPFKQLYIADINAIQKNGQHQAIIEQINQQFPQLEIWLDAGFSKACDLQDWQQTNIRIVLGSESINDLYEYQALIEACAHEPILSLDFKQEAFLGNEALLSNPKLWPNDVIVMTLDKVGSQSGPDTKRLKAINALAGNTVRMFAAGGVSGLPDLLALKSAKISGALIASALHNGSLNQAALLDF